MPGPVRTEPSPGVTSALAFSAAAGAAAAAAALGPVLARYAARRAAAQPVGVDLVAEAVALAHLRDHPDHHAFADLREQDFTTPDNRATFATMRPQSDTVAPPGSRQSLPWREEVELVKAVRTLRQLAYDRSLQGKVPAVASTGPSPWDRVYQAPSRRRLVTVGGSLAVTAAVLSLTAPVVPWPARVAYLSALAVLILTCTASALIDRDTLYVDGPRLLAGVALSWAAGCLGAVLAGDPYLPFLSAALTGMLLGLLGLLSGVFRLVCGRSGVASGDLLALAGIVGVPALITGATAVPLAALTTGVVLVLAQGAVRAVALPGSRRQPFSWVPALTAGLVIAWTICALT